MKRYELDFESTTSYFTNEYDNTKDIIKFLKEDNKKCNWSYSITVYDNKIKDFIFWKDNGSNNYETTLNLN